MKILIISHYYKHKNAMASVRAIKLAKYFSLLGQDVTVLASMQKDNWCKQEVKPEEDKNVREIYAPEYKGMDFLRKINKLAKARGDKKMQRVKEEQAKATEATCESNADNASEQTTDKKTKENLKVKVKKFISWLYYYSCDRLENRFLYLGFVQEIKRSELNNFDCVIATYPGAGAHRAGVWMKKHKKTKSFIADYRDPAYNPGGRGNKIEAAHDKRIQDMAVRSADCIVCVSKGMAQTLKGQYAKERISPVKVINNGFDLDDNAFENLNLLPKDKFNFVYTGALYNGRRSVEMLGKVLAELAYEGSIKKEMLALHYAGSDFSELEAQLKPFGLEDIAVDHGFVTRKESLSMQKEASVVLLLNWNQDNYTGVIPGKIYEYMASQNQICALIMGNEPNSETANMIREDNLGCACEQAAPQDIIALKAYVLGLIKAFEAKESKSINLEAVEKYQYKNLAAKYLEIIKDTVSATKK